MSMDVMSVGGALPPPPAAPPRTGAFSRLRSRWLIVWAILGAAIMVGLAAVMSELTGIPDSDELLGVLLYLPIVAWVVVMVVRRAGVDLAAMLRWPRLGTYWWVVAGMLVVQFIFSLAAITLTGLVAPWMDDSLEGVGQGNLVLAVLGLVIVPPLVEEIVFRGILLERFTVKWRVGVAIIVSAVAFGILHADPVGAGMFGVITALLYLRTGSLWPGIIIHFVNNLVALVATRLADPGPTGADPALSESLLTAGVLLLVSVPFLVLFIRANWPARNAPTPYQLHEMRTGLPPATFPSIVWSGAPRPVRVDVTSTHVSVADESGSPIAILPLERVHSVYPTAAPVGTQIVLLLSDGSWTTMRVPSQDPKQNQAFALALSERVRFASPQMVAAASR